GLRRPLQCDERDPARRLARLGRDPTLVDAREAGAAEQAEQRRPRRRPRARIVERAPQRLQPLLLARGRVVLEKRLTPVGGTVVDSLLAAVQRDGRVDDQYAAAHFRDPLDEP